MKNFTPHDVRLILGKVVRVFPTVGVCRALSTERCAEVRHFPSIAGERMTVHHRGNWVGDQPDGVAVVMEPPSYHGLEWIPAPPALGDTVIVSIVAAPVVARHRRDLSIYVPDTGPKSAVRSTAGQIEGVKRLILWHRPFKPIEVIVPYNPANPYDGWEVVAEFPESLWSDAVELAARTGSAMYLVPGCQPCDAGGFDSQDGPRRESVKSYLTGGTTHWEHLKKEGQRDLDEGRERCSSKEIPEGCWARRAYDDGYGDVAKEDTP